MSTRIHSIEMPFISELSGLLAIDDIKRKRIETDSSTDSHDTIDTASYSEGSFSSIEAEALALNSILKKTESKEGVIKDNDKNWLRSWIEQPVPSTTSLRIRRRRRRSTAIESSPSKFECVKTSFPGREGRRSRREPRARKPRTEKTVEEQWVRTCRFL
ncbi:unnamed protein product [Cylindrotheca closterium]|uniref:Uncharacterized protein n=1 Tax=Cylindrotheca closterium TaxID=2856 RepID=A0AAD2CK43_9STRA|nr:unnamed protein product [Cylindrotheca closterium]